MSNWYYEVLGEPVGPVAARELKRLASAGKVTPFTNVRLGEGGNWVPASQVNGLFTSPAPEPAPTPTAPLPVEREIVQESPDTEPSRRSAKPRTIKGMLGISADESAAFTDEIGDRWPRIRIVANQIDRSSTWVAVLTAIVVLWSGVSSMYEAFFAYGDPEAVNPLVLLIMAAFYIFFAFAFARGAYYFMAIQADLLRCLAVIEHNTRSNHDAQPRG